MASLELNLFCIGKGATVTFLLRSPDAFKDDAEIQKYVQAGKAFLVQGDGLKSDDVARGWTTAQAASPSAQVDLVLFTLGEYIYCRLRRID